MRTTFDLSSLYRSGVGFDRMLNALEATGAGEPIDNWPPYDITKSGDDEYHILIAVAGFSEDDLAITQEGSSLMVTGQKTANSDVEYLHHGIAERSFRRRFQLADHVRVTNAVMVNGLLKIDLRHEIPDEMKPHRIEISKPNSLTSTETKQIRTDRQAA